MSTAFNSLSRTVGMLQGQAIDCAPRMPILMAFAVRQINSTYGAFASDYRVLVQANLACAKDFGIDQLSTISDPYRETSALGGAVEFISDGVPRCEQPPLANDSSLERLGEPDPRHTPRTLDRIHAVEAYRQASQGQHSILGWVEGPAAEACDLRGMVHFLMDLLIDEGYASELMDRCVAFAIRFAQAQIAAGADMVGIGDAVCSQISADSYERLILPRQRRLVDAIHQAGARVRMHICGNITHLLPGLASLGLDVLDVDHMVRLASVREAVGDRVALVSNLDPVNTILNGTPATIRRALAAAYAEAGRPFCVGAGCEIPRDTPPENLLALCEPLPCH